MTDLTLWVSEKRNEWTHALMDFGPDISLATRKFYYCRNQNDGVF